LDLTRSNQDEFKISWNRCKHIKGNLVKKGIILGHEVQALSKVGADVRNVKPGDEVIVAPYLFGSVCYRAGDAMLQKRASRY
jgi:threonine dehydrogenase-like Zn-dependent dehydrogenase